jgi:hypothetical protein
MSSDGQWIFRRLTVCAVRMALPQLPVWNTQFSGFAGGSVNERSHSSRIHRLVKRNELNSKCKI